MSSIPSFRPRGDIGVTARGDVVKMSPEFQRWLELLTRVQDQTIVTSEKSAAVFASYPASIVQSVSVTSEATLFASYPSSSGSSITADYPVAFTETIFAEY